VTGIVPLITTLGQRIGRLFLAKVKSKKPSESEVAKHALLRVMRDWSEDAYAAGWQDGLEVTIWGMILKWEGGDEGVHTLDAAMFRYLSDKAKGWWVWDEAAGHPAFIPLKTWKGMYAELLKALKETQAQNDTTA
jgi:hypothetical protein